MHRCLELAKLGTGYTAPNPLVGAVLVHGDRIIGEGFHKKYSEAHAEVNCLLSVKEEDHEFIPLSTLYVSLEPCTHHGKTPPCTDLIIQKKIPNVVIGCLDPFKEVNGKGIEKLQKAGVKLETGVLENDCKELNKRFFTFHTLHRPYIILKWAQTMNGKIAAQGSDRLHISNEFTNRLVHKWRSEEAAILVGTNTALVDDPSLTTRLWRGPSPIRLVVDMDLRLPLSLKLFNGETTTILFNKIKHSLPENILTSSSHGPFYYQVTDDVNFVHQFLNALYNLKIQSVIVEGGARLLQSFIDEKAWDESRVITNEALVTGDGLNAPRLTGNSLKKSEKIFSDKVSVYFNSL